jgi:hypothetical protein
MESQPQSSDVSQAEPKKSRFPVWAIILIKVIAVPVLCISGDYPHLLISSKTNIVG